VVGKRVQLDDETWDAIQLEKHNQPIGLKAASEASAPARSKVSRARTN